MLKDMAFSSDIEGKLKDDMMIIADADQALQSCIASKAKVSSNRSQWAIHNSQMVAKTARLLGLRNTSLLLNAQKGSFQQLATLQLRKRFWLLCTHAISNCMSFLQAGCLAKNPFMMSSLALDLISGKHK